ncbi:endonuclease/exonuclease/phosphatase family protein [Paenibacillus sp. FJAT-26967]|uniref:endonuclease/exonuclease/phosphatase family protein n=1 Tax=Paenibacillus sp. FJAT-26967 TaxID=1729690 RepID=UPI0008391375|nr:endonuclease/exonuclease/phosphatase family protein [Paenibacillus sp. FJAT-26967]
MSRMQPIPLKVMSFNIHSGVNLAGQLNLQAIASVIMQEKPDLVGLQEVDSHYSERSDFADQLEWLADYLGMNGVYGPNLDQDPLQSGMPRRRYGTAILSRFPVIGSHNHHLSSFGDEQRGLLEAQIQIGAREIFFYNTHLGLSTGQRVQQSSEVAETILSQKRAHTVILTGDFNACPGSPELAVLADAGLADVFEGLRYEANTFPSDQPADRIDYIWYRGSLVKISAEVLHTQVSDHCPIVAGFTFGG